MITATTTAARPMRYSFPEKSSSILPWQSSCRAARRRQGAHPPAPRGSSPPPMEGHSRAPGAPRRGVEGTWSLASVNSEHAEGTLPGSETRPRPGLAHSPNSSRCMAQHDHCLAVARGGPGRPCHHPGPTKGWQPNRNPHAP